MTLKLIFLFLLSALSLDVFATNGVIKEKKAHIIVQSLSSKSIHWLCTASSTFFLDGKNLKSVKSTIWIKIDFRRNIYARCDKKGCSRCDFTLSISGRYTNILLPKCAAFIKINNINYSFVDMTTLTNHVFVSYGRCRMNQSNSNVGKI